MRQTVDMTSQGDMFWKYQEGAPAGGAHVRPASHHVPPHAQPQSHSHHKSHAGDDGTL